MKSVALVSLILSLNGTPAPNQINEGRGLYKQYKPLPTLNVTVPSYLEPLEPTYIGQVYNNYFKGECVEYAYLRRLELGNPVPGGLGNASTWLERAISMGMATGSEPRVGAVVWFYPGNSEGHVAVVEEVYGDSIYISEQNVVGKGVTSYRTISAYGVEYIY